MTSMPFGPHTYLQGKRLTFTHLWSGIQIPEFPAQFAKLQIYITGFSFFSCKPL